MTANVIVPTSTTTNPHWILIATAIIALVCIIALVRIYGIRKRSGLTIGAATSVFGLWVAVMLTIFGFTSPGTVLAHSGASITYVDPDVLHDELARAGYIQQDDGQHPARGDSTWLVNGAWKKECTPHFGGISGNAVQVLSLTCDGQTIPVR